MSASSFIPESNPSMCKRSADESIAGRMIGQGFVWSLRTKKHSAFVHVRSFIE